MKKIFVRGDREKMKNYDEALTGVGFSPVFSLDPSAAEDCCALLLPGGGDVDPARYGQQNEACSDIDLERDRDELRLIRAFSHAHKPIFGICRGLQILNVAFGGTLCQDIEAAPVHRWEEATGDKVHRIGVTENSFLFPLYGKEFPVNSAHHQAIDQPAPNFIVAAQAADGVIEAVEDPAGGIYAVQFHPERMAFGHRRPDTVDGRRIFEFFYEVCRS